MWVQFWDGNNLLCPTSLSHFLLLESFTEDLDSPHKFLPSLRYSLFWNSHHNIAFCNKCPNIIFAQYAPKRHSSSLLSRHQYLWIHNWVSGCGEKQIHYHDPFISGVIGVMCLRAMSGFGWIDRLKVCKNHFITFILCAFLFHFLKSPCLSPNISSP